MEPEKDERRDLLDTPAARTAEVVMWIVVALAAAAHVYRVVAMGAVFGGIDTFAFFFVAAVVLGGVRLLRWRRRR